MKQLKHNIDMMTSNIEIQSIVDYICSHSSYVCLDKKDIESVCPNPTLCVDKKGETLEETLDAVKSALSSSPLPHPSKVVMYIESQILTMSDFEGLNDYLQGFNAYKLGCNFETPEGGNVRILLIG